MYASVLNCSGAKHLADFSVEADRLAVTRFEAAYRMKGCSVARSKTAHLMFKIG
jgi:hypothetical protein